MNKYKLIVYLNNDTNFLTGCNPTDRLLRIGEEEIVESPTIKGALEILWIKYNVDSRPGNKCVRSMSIGDVIVVTQINDLDVRKVFTADFVGFKELSESEVNLPQGGADVRTRWKERSEKAT